MKAASAFLPPSAASVPTASGKRPWMLVLLLVSMGFVLLALLPERVFVLLALLPERVRVSGSLQLNLVKARFVFAAVGISSFVALVVPLLTAALQ